MPKSVRLDLTGHRFGLLTVEKYSYTKNNRVYWLCKCDCGNTKEVQKSSLKNGGTKSCGCLLKLKSKQRAIERNTKHGGSLLPEYVIWNGMKARCYNENEPSFENYGGRGITVCDRWRDSFENFFSDMGERPSPKHSIDRIDVNWNYEPSNCRWATATEQARNRRTKNISGKCGVRFNKRSKKWTAEIKVDKRVLLGYFYSVEEAVSARRLAELKYWGDNGKD